MSRPPCRCVPVVHWAPFTPTPPYTQTLTRPPARYTLVTTHPNITVCNARRCTRHHSPPHHPAQTLTSSPVGPSHRVAINQGCTRPLRNSHTSRRAPLQPVIVSQVPCTPYHPPNIAGVRAEKRVRRAGQAGSRHRQPLALSRIVQVQSTALPVSYALCTYGPS